MLSERFQILLSPEQRRRLELEAKERSTSVAALIREAIEAHLHLVTPEERLRAAEEIVAMRTGVELTPEEIGELIAEERERVVNGPPASSG